MKPTTGGKVEIGTSIESPGSITSSGGAIGYATGAGGAVTQLTAKTTAVTVDALSGQITMNNAAMTNASAQNFQVNNSQVDSTDTIILNLQGGAAGATAYRYWVCTVGAGFFKIAVENRSGGPLSEALVFNFAVIRAVNA